MKKFYESVQVSIIKNMNKTEFFAHKFECGDCTYIGTKYYVIRIPENECVLNTEKFKSTDYYAMFNKITTKYSVPMIVTDIIVTLPQGKIRILKLNKNGKIQYMGINESYYKMVYQKGCKVFVDSTMSTSEPKEIYLSMSEQYDDYESIYASIAPVKISEEQLEEITCLDDIN